jgi:leucyl aminopeptidase
VADIKNVGDGRWGGAITAAKFLEEFVAGKPWVHLDIAGPARAGGDDGYLVKGGTGFAVRTLVELVDRFKKPARSRTAH